MTRGKRRSALMEIPADMLRCKGGRSQLVGVAAAKKINAQRLPILHDIKLSDVKVSRLSCFTLRLSA